MCLNLVLHSPQWCTCMSSNYMLKKHSFKMCLDAALFKMRIASLIYYNVCMVWPILKMGYSIVPDVSEKPLQKQ